LQTSLINCILEAGHCHNKRHSVVLADRIQLQQVLINLVMNGIEAVQAVPDRQPESAIRSRQGEADQVRVTVKDDGVGITAEDAGRPFKPSSPPKSAAWAWDCRSAVRSSKRTGGNFRPPTISGRAQRFNSPCPRTNQPRRELAAPTA
jgi:hypothetical protein